MKAVFVLEKLEKSQNLIKEKKKKKPGKQSVSSAEPVPPVAEVETAVEHKISREGNNLSIILNFRNIVNWIK